MMKNNIYITDITLQIATNYLQSQFDVKSWWPQAQPRLAEHEFLLMKGSAGALTVWCDRWLDKSQCRKLEMIIKQAR